MAIDETTTELTAQQLVDLGVATNAPVQWWSILSVGWVRDGFHEPSQRIAAGLAPVERRLTR